MLSYRTLRSDFTISVFVAPKCLISSSTNVTLKYPHTLPMRKWAGGPSTHHQRQSRARLVG